MNTEVLFEVSVSVRYYDIAEATPNTVRRIRQQLEYYA